MEVSTKDKVNQTGENRVEITRLSKWEDVLEYSTQWRELVEQADSQSIFQTFEWHDSWWHAFGNGNDLMVILCHVKGQLVGIAPMMLTRSARALVRDQVELRFVGCLNDSSDYLQFIVDSRTPNVLEYILQEVLGVLRTIDRVVLSHYPTHLLSHDLVVNFLQRENIRSQVQFHQEAPCRILGNKKDDRRIAAKSSLRRRYNYFHKSGDLRFFHCQAEEEANGLLNEFFDQHIARRNMTGTSSQFHIPQERVFYRNLIQKLMPTDWLRFAVVLYDDKPIAFHFGFEYRDKFYWYKPAFDVKFAKRSPGEVLIKFLLEYAIETDLGEFDFTVGSEPFKYRFSNKVRYNNQITLFSGRVDYYLYRRKRVVQHLRQRLARVRSALLTRHSTQ